MFIHINARRKKKLAKICLIGPMNTDIYSNRPAESIGSEDLAILKNVQKAANLGYCTKGTKTREHL